MVKVLVTGSSSSPGFKTVEILAEKGYKVYAVYNRNAVPAVSMDVVPLQLDLTDFDRVRQILSEVKPDIVVHMAAYGDVDGCEVNREYAWRVNVEATRFLAKISRDLGVSYFIYLSTDYVFDGSRGMYREDDVPKPINFYGLTKLIGEEIVRAVLDRFVVVRTSAIYGLGMGRMNFGKFLIEALSRGQQVKAFIDQYLSPTLNTLLAKAVAEIIERSDIVGVIHVAGERVSRYEFAVRLAEKLGFNKELIQPAKMEEARFKAPRPRDSSLDCSKARSILKTEFYNLDHALDVLRQEYIRMKSSI